MKAFWEKLSKRQQVILSMGGSLALILLLIQFFLLPFLDAKRTLNQAIRNNEKIFGEMTLLAREYHELKRKTERIRQALAARPREFTLFSYLERIAGQTGVKSNIKYINASKGAVTGPYEEMPVEIKLEKITLRQLTDFLYLLESAQELIKINRIAISKMKESPEYLAAQIQAATIQLTKTDGR